MLCKLLNFSKELISHCSFTHFYSRAQSHFNRYFVIFHPTWNYVCVCELPKSFLMWKHFQFFICCTLAFNSTLIQFPVPSFHCNRSRVINVYDFEAQSIFFTTLNMFVARNVNLLFLHAIDSIERWLKYVYSICIKWFFIRTNK